MKTADNSNIETFEFSIFRLRNLIYSIPACAIFLWGFVKFTPILDEWMLGINPLLKLLAMLISLVVFCVILIKVFFGINVQKTVIYLNHEGFWLNSLDSKRISWSDVRHIAFSKDKYERQSNSASSSVFISLGSMKILALHCSTWTILDKTRRANYNQNFEAFKIVLSNYCPVHPRFRD